MYDLQMNASDICYKKDKHKNENKNSFVVFLYVV